MPRTTSIRITLEDVERSRYLEIPFDVAGPDARIGVTLGYDRSAGAAIDLGLLDPDGVRGWSGGARSTFVVAATEATPGYRPGPISRGRWAVLLGLYRVPADGVAVTVTIDTQCGDRPDVEVPGPEPRPGPRGSGRLLPAPTGLTWYAGDLHAHTVHSDGSLSIGELAARGAAAGLDFMAVTDHNTISHHPLLAAAGDVHDIALLPGQEVTTVHGHANVLGDVGLVDFRTPPDAWRVHAEREGGLMSINHPLEDDCGWLHRMDVYPPALELWHIGWFRNLADNRPWALSNVWPTLPIVVGGSDFHRPEQGFPPGTPTTWVAAEDRSTEAILAAIKAGRTTITRSAAPGGPILIPMDGELLALDADGSSLVSPSGRTRVVRGDRAQFDVREAGIHRIETAITREPLGICVGTVY